MALPDYVGLVAGTAITWKSSGGDKVITLTSLANAAGREGVKSASFNDATYGMPELLEVRFESSVAVTVTDGKSIELYFGESSSATAATDNPGNLTGADAALSNPSELKRQCYRVGALSLSAARTTSVQKQRFRYKPVCEYITPLVVNVSGQALGSTAGDHQIVVTPYYSRLKE